MTSNPYESPENPEAVIEHRQSGSRLRILGYVVGAFVILGLLIAMMLPVTRRARPAALRNGCLNNMRQLGLAILNYESVHGTLPPAYTVDENGNRLHSWRTLILPYIEEQALYESIDLTKPWDHPDNAAAYEVIPSVFVCPGSRSDDNVTYMAVEGPDCCFNGSTPRSLSEITDGSAKTIMIIEVGEKHAVHWMEPRDADESTILSFGPDWVTGHNGIIIASFVDNHTRSISLETPQEKLRAMLTIAGGEEIEE